MSAMYKLRPISLANPHIEIPACIYRMRKIFDTDLASIPVAQHDELEELEKRWDNIESRLHRLRDNINALRREREADPSPPQAPGLEREVSVGKISVQQEAVVLRISDLKASLSQLKSRLALMDDPQNMCSAASLREQQKGLLERIHQLNVDIGKLSAGLSSDRCCQLTGQPSGLKPCETVQQGSKNEFIDVVIRANPVRPPYSLPILARWLSECGVAVYTSTHVHSSVAASVVTPALRRFLPAPRVERGGAQVSITLIWFFNGGEEAECMSCPSQQSVSIRGEANIGRYLSRLFPLQLAYENSAGVDSAAEIDRLLDMTEAGAVFGVGGAASAAGPGHNKDRGQALNILEQALLQRPAAGVTALPDAVVYSALLNSKVTPASVGAALRPWMEQCNRMAAF